MAAFIVPEEHKEEIMKKMSPINIKYYDKNMKPIIVPSHGVIHGYIMCTQIEKIPGKKPLRFETLDELEKAYDEERVELKELVYLDGEATTYGRAKMEFYFGEKIHNILGVEDPLAEITTKNNMEVFKWLAVQPESAEIAKNVRMFVLEMSTLEGFTSLSIDTLNTNVPEEYTDKYKSLLEDPNMDSVAKFVRLNALSNEIKVWIQENMNQDMRATMEASNRSFNAA